MNAETEAVEMTPRTCRWCRRPYLAPKGSRPGGCHGCAPTLDDVIDGVHIVGGSVAVEVRERSVRVTGLQLLDAATGNAYALPNDGIPF